MPKITTIPLGDEMNDAAVCFIESDNGETSFWIGPQSQSTSMSNISQHGTFLSRADLLDLCASVCKASAAGRLPE